MLRFVRWKPGFPITNNYLGIICQWPPPTILKLAKHYHDICAPKTGVTDGELSFGEGLLMILTIK